MLNQINSVLKSKNWHSNQRLRMFILLCISTLFNFALLGYRMYHLEFNYTQIDAVKNIDMLKGTTSFLFLVWNLFLAWIPYWIAISMGSIHRQFSSWLLTGTCLIGWLLFFPNAPYILTDFLHLRSRAPIPQWYDLMLIASFAWTGLILGLLSLYEVQRFLKDQIGNRLAWVIAICCIFLCGFGIYVGRFLRWNSWDVFTRPIDLITQLVEVVSRPDIYGNTVGISLVLGVFLLLAYLKMVLLIDAKVILR